MAVIILGKLFNGPRALRKKASTAAAADSGAISPPRLTKARIKAAARRPPPGPARSEKRLPRGAARLTSLHMSVVVVVGGNRETDGIISESGNVQTSSSS